MRSNRWFLERARRAFDYQFPPSGRLGHGIFERTTRQEFETELFPGIRVPLDMRDALQKMTYWFGRRYESPTGFIFEKWCRDAEAFFDIGSNYGFYSWWMASLRRDLAIHLFEPNPAQHPRIEQILSINALTNVHLHKVGLADTAALLQFRVAENSGCSTFGSYDGIGSTQVIEAPVTTFDAFCRAQSLAFPARPAWVAKIDAEGFDLKVVRGMHESLSARAFKALCIEASDTYLRPNEASSSEIDEVLRSHGFTPTHAPRHRTGASPCENAFYVLAK